MLSQRHILELTNGVWAIIALWLVVFLVYHLVKVGAQRHITLRRWLFGLPTSMQLAFSMLVISAAICGTRGTIWFSRASNQGQLELRLVEQSAYIGFSFLGVVGFLCALRIITRPGLGHWPWLSAVAASLVYIAFMLTIIF